MAKKRSIRIIERGIITVLYNLLTLNMFLQAEMLLLSRYNNLKMFACMNILQIRKCEYNS